jgi:hypothetical protein
VGLPTLQNYFDSQCKTIPVFGLKKQIQGTAFFCPLNIPQFICVLASQVPELVPELQLASQELVPELQLASEPQQLASEPQALVFQPAYNLV